MDRIVEKYCLVCWEKYPTYALPRDKNKETIRRAKGGGTTIRTRYSRTCSKHCSKIYTRVIAHYLGRQKDTGV